MVACSNIIHDVDKSQYCNSVLKVGSSYTAPSPNSIAPSFCEYICVVAVFSIHVFKTGEILSRLFRANRGNFCHTAINHHLHWYWMETIYPKGKFGVFFCFFALLVIILFMQLEFTTTLTLNSIINVKWWWSHLNWIVA